MSGESHRPSEASDGLDKLCVDAVRVLSMDAVQKANSGHPGTPMALAPVGYVLWTRHLKHNPANPLWPDRDRFVLSVGHASMLIYSLLHLTGYDLALEEIKNFRQLGSRTPGHPEVGHTPGVETTTGPLGQGITNSVGMALTERWLAARFNRPGHEIVDHHTIVLCSDGDMMEGISHEAAELAGHQRLGKLIWIFDDNEITIEGSTNLASSTNQALRFQSYGWNVLTVKDGEDLDAIDGAIAEAKADSEKPTLIVLKTIIANGSPNKAGTSGAHGAPLGEDEIAATKTNIGYPSQDPFYVDPDALAKWRETVDQGTQAEQSWRERFAAYQTEYPELAEELNATLDGSLPDGWDDDLATEAGVSGADATRSSSGKVLQVLASRIPNLVGGSADLGSSNKTDIIGAEDLLAQSPGGRVMHFGVREHGMGGILNGMALHGGVRPFGGTFLIFSDYMRPSIRLAALMNLPVRYVFTHDSIGLGEDGPTHQPIEQVMTLRSIPGLLDLRPGDPSETVEAWKAALRYGTGPSFLALTRQKLPETDRAALGATADGLHCGAYVLAEASSELQMILVASGSELQLVIEARERLEQSGIGTRVVSFPSWHLFEEQEESYRAEVLPHDIPKVAIEAGSTFGWHRWLGSHSTALGIDTFGQSAPAELLFQEFGITTDAVVNAAQDLL